MEIKVFSEKVLVLNPFQETQFTTSPTCFDHMSMTLATFLLPWITTILNTMFATHFALNCKLIRLWKKFTSFLRKSNFVKHFNKRKLKCKSATKNEIRDCCPSWLNRANGKLISNKINSSELTKRSFQIGKRSAWNSKARGAIDAIDEREDNPVVAWLRTKD